MIEFEFDLVGGGYDGVGGLSWRDDGKHPCPDVILVGVCGKGRNCGMAACRAAKTHVAFWTPDEDDRPLRAETYEKQDEFVTRGADDELAGRAVYAIGGLLDPKNFGATAREPVGVGADDDGAAFPRVTAHVNCGSGLLPAGRHDRGWRR